VEGLSFEEALQRWSPPDKYAAMLELKSPRTSMDFRIKGISARKREYRLAREELEDGLFELLRRGELRSSAGNPLGGEDDPRVLVDPDVYNDQRLSYDPVGECIVGSDVRLQDVRIFGRNRVPLGLDEALRLTASPTSPTTARSLEAGMPPSGEAGFRHDATYEHVWIGNQEFLLTRFQADVVRELHQAWVRGQPWMHREQLREAVRFESDKLSHLFRRMPDWHELIFSDRRGNYRLNL
jgi:hypothetical protein